MYLLGINGHLSVIYLHILSFLFYNLQLSICCSVVLLDINIYYIRRLCKDVVFGCSTGRISAIFVHQFYNKKLKVAFGNKEQTKERTIGVSVLFSLFIYSSVVCEIVYKSSRIFLFFVSSVVYRSKVTIFVKSGDNIKCSCLILY